MYAAIQSTNLSNENTARRRVSSTDRPRAIKLGLTLVLASTHWMDGCESNLLRPVNTVACVKYSTIK